MASDVKCEAATSAGETWQAILNLKPGSFPPLHGFQPLAVYSGAPLAWPYFGAATTLAPSVSDAEAAAAAGAADSLKLLNSGAGRVATADGNPKEQEREPERVAEGGAEQPEFNQGSVPTDGLAPPAASGPVAAGIEAAALAALAAAQTQVQAASGESWRHRMGQLGSGTQSQALSSDSPPAAADDREQKRQRRKESNRESARRSRLRKQAECEHLAETVNYMNDALKRAEAENDRLKDENKELRAELKELEAKLGVQPIAA